MVNFGFSPSVLTGDEHIFNVEATMDFPEKYSYQDALPTVLNQGSKPICVPCSLSAYLNWSENFKDGSNKDNKVNYDEIFNARDKSMSDGMSFKDALHFLRHSGVSSDSGILKINHYAMVKSQIALKNAIVMNGPCVGGLPVYNYNDKFWVKGYGDELQGYHAVSIVGYDEKLNFILRNSWGKSYGNNGYMKIPYDDIKFFYEMWTIIE